MLNQATIMIVGARHPVASDLAVGFAQTGARVIAVDPSPDAVQALCERGGHRIEPLVFDPENGSHCKALEDIWGDEPLAMLLQFQPLNDCSNPARAALSVTQMNAAVSDGLAKARGLSLYLYPQADANVVEKPCAKTFEGLARDLQGTMSQERVSINGLALPEAPLARKDKIALRWLIEALVPPLSLVVGGSILHLQQRSD